MQFFLLNLLSGIILASIFFTILSVVWVVLEIVAQWMVFTKAGEAGWKSIIPFYGDFVFYRICWDTRFFWISLVLSLIRQLLDKDDAGFFLSVVVFLLGLVIAAIDFLFCCQLAKAFGKSIGFALGLFFLKPIFMMILGFGSARYLGNNSYRP